MQLWLAVLFFWATCFYSQEPVLDDSSGIIIEFTLNERTFPESWKTKEINATGISLDSSEVERTVQIIKKALKKYPREILSRNLKKVIVLESIKFYGQAYGGTNSTNTVYISNKGIINNYTEYYIEKSFHHEFSSILLRNYPGLFNEKKWRKLNKIKYGQGGVAALKNKKAGQEFDSTFNVNGFLHEYGTSDIENDFNSFAENIFIPDAGFWELINVYPNLKEKLSIIIQFYTALSRTFNRRYFEAFNKEVIEAR